MTRFTLLFVVLWAAPCQAETPKLFRERSFTCADVAEAVNHFVALGEEAGTNELDSMTVDPISDIFMGAFSRNERIGWVCRILFQPQGKDPLRGPLFGGHSLPWNSMPLTKWPFHPVAASGSTYFVLSEGYTLAGTPEDPKAYLKYCRTKAKFRVGRAAMPTRAQALKDLEQLRQSEAWKAIKWQDSGPGFFYIISEDWSWRFIRAQAEKLPAE